jgi:hypothetical protein
VHAAVGILDHARGLQQYLAERRGGAQRLLLDVLGGDLVLAAADVRRQRVAGLVELGADGDRVQVLDRGRSSAAEAKAGRLARARAKVMPVARGEGFMGMGCGRGRWGWSVTS